MSELVTIYVTCGTEDEAASIARTLVGEGLAACGNIFSGVRSIYSWQGEVQDEGEVALLLKTRAAVADEAVARIAALHSYDQPCIEVWPVTGAAEGFTAWVAAQATKSR